MCDYRENILFVGEVEKHPVLYNYRLPGYSKKDVVDNAWMEVARNMNMTEPNCRERWKNIRTAFGRSMRPKSGSGKRWKKPYYLADYLDFLRPLMKGASKSGRAPTEEQTEKQETDTKDAKLMLPDTSKVTPPELMKTEIHQDPTPCKASRRPERPPVRNDPKEKFFEWIELKKNETKIVEEEKEDGDWYFFRSLHHDFKKLSEKRKRFLKLKFTTLLHDELESADAEVKASSANYSSS